MTLVIEQIIKQNNVIFQLKQGIRFSLFLSLALNISWEQGGHRCLVCHAGTTQLVQLQQRWSRHK